MSSDERHAPSHEPRAVHIFAAAGWTIAASLVFILLLALTASARSGALADRVSYTACQVLAYSIVLFVMLRLYAPASPMREALAFRPVSPIHILLSAVAGAGISPALSKLDDLVQQRFPVSPEELEQQGHVLADGKWVLIACVVFVIPIAEELFFRGMLYGCVKRGRRAGTAMFVTSLLYAATLGSHFDTRWAPGAFVAALVLSWLRAQSGSVVSACAAHVAFYAVPVVPLVMGRGLDESAPMTLTAAAMGAAICALVAGRFLGGRDARALEARAEDE